MLRCAPLSTALLGALVLGCGGDDTEPPPTGDPLPTCEAPEVALPDGSCIRPGIPPDGCFEGFIHDGEYGCEPILPPEPCPPGLMAVPGETECRPVMPCGEGTWGDLPTDGATQHVDGSYVGGGSDGSATAPWTTIGEAVAAAAPGGLVAVAAGSYVEDVMIVGKPLRLWGRCPEMVEIVGTGAELAAVVIPSGASGSQVGGVALRGAAAGFALSGSEDVVVDRAWVHDTASRGIDAEGVLGPTSVAVVGSLVEQSHECGVFVAGADALVEGTVVRASLPGASNEPSGRGISVQACGTQGGCTPKVRGNAIVRGSLLEQNHDVGLHVSGSDATVEGTVIRATLPRASDQIGGHGINIQLECTQGVCDPIARGNATLRGSLVEQNHEVGVTVSGSDVLVEGTVVRATWPRVSDQMHGRGINIQSSCYGGVCDPALRGNVTLRGSLVDRSHDVGLAVIGSDALVEGVVVRATVPRASDGFFGDGIDIVSFEAVASATITGTVIADSSRAGLASFGASASVGSIHILCAGYELEGEVYQGQDFAFEDLGGNACGCPTAAGACVVESAGLAPPEPSPTLP